MIQSYELFSTAVPLFSSVQNSQLAPMHLCRNQTRPSEPIERPPPVPTLPIHPPKIKPLVGAAGGTSFRQKHSVPTPMRPPLLMPNRLPPPPTTPPASRPQSRLIYTLTWCISTVQFLSPS